MNFVGVLVLFLVFLVGGLMNAVQDFVRLGASLVNPAVEYEPWNPIPLVALFGFFLLLCVAALTYASSRRPPDGSE